MTTWKEQIEKAMQNSGESFADVISCTLSEEELNVEFNDGFGYAEGKPFTLWTKDRVYFPTCFNGAEWAASVPRNPNGIPTPHVGEG